MEVYSLSRVEYKIYCFFMNKLFVDKTTVFSEGQKSLAKAVGCHD